MRASLRASRRDTDSGERTDAPQSPFVSAGTAASVTSTTAEGSASDERTDATESPSVSAGTAASVTSTTAEGSASDERTDATESPSFRPVPQRA